MAITKELFLLGIQDRKVQALMDDLDLPADRATLRGAELTRGTRAIDSIWSIFYRSSMYGGCMVMKLASTRSYTAGDLKAI